MTPDELTEAARRIKGFGDLPIASQITLLYNEITAAQQSRIPISLICGALNAAGSKIGSKYFRDAMSIARRRMKSLEGKGGESAPLPAPSAARPVAPKPATNSAPAAKESPRLPSAKAREEKANAYMGSDNPLLSQLGKKD